MKVFIIDGSSFLYRAYYSIKPLTATYKPTGQQMMVNAVYGFCRMVKKLINQQNPDHLVVAWDSKGKTIRHEIYPEYKETRQAAPTDLFQQKVMIQEFCDLVGIHQVEQTGVEADDLMYSIALGMKEQGIESVVVTSDKDLRQILDQENKITIFDPFKDGFMDYNAAGLRYGFNVEKLPFYFSLIGDASDNIPGVKGIGPKTAEQIVNQFKSLDDLYANLDKIERDRIRDLLATHKSDAYLSLDLFTLRKIDLENNPEKYAYNHENWNNSSEFFKNLNFKSLLSDSEVSGVASAKTEALAADLEKKRELAKKYKFILVNQREQLENLVNKIKQFGAFAIDTEGLSLDPLMKSIVGISISVEEGESYYIPFGHKATEQLSKQEVIDILKPVFESFDIKKYMHNAKFDILMLFSIGITVNNIEFDTILAASLLLTENQSIGLKNLSEYYFNEPMLSFQNVVKDLKYKSFADVPLDLATKYSAADAHQTLKLVKIFREQLKENNLEHLFYNLEMPFLRLLVEIEKEGIFLDVAHLKTIGTNVDQEILDLNKKIIDLVGEEYKDINLNSPKQVEDLLFNYLKLPIVKKTYSKNSYSTDVEVLTELAKLHPVPELLLKYRELFKIKSTYIEALPDYKNKYTNRIHTSFNQTSVATGRLASSDPNLQNIPVDKLSIRSAFKPKEGYKFIAADYSQIELRVLAYLSQDPTLLEAFNKDIDIHALTASGLFNVPVDQVTSEQRQIGKKINFSILYGITPHGLSKQLNISNSQAKLYIDRYMATYPFVSQWMSDVIAKTQEKGYVETVHARRRHISYIHEKNKNLFQLGCRLAINTMGQGTASEIVKLGMLKLQEDLVKNNLNAKILLQIHDELLLEVPESEVEIVKNLVKNNLESAVCWNLPISVSLKIGENWQDVTK